MNLKQLLVQFQFASSLSDHTHSCFAVAVVATSINITTAVAVHLARLTSYLFYYSCYRLYLYLSHDPTLHNFRLVAIVTITTIVDETTAPTIIVIVTIIIIATKFEYYFVVVQAKELHSFLIFAFKVVLYNSRQLRHLLFCAAQYSTQLSSLQKPTLPAKACRH